jgi:hypothetical protein
MHGAEMCKRLSPEAKKLHTIKKSYPVKSYGAARIQKSGVRNKLNDFKMDTQG